MTSPRNFWRSDHPERIRKRSLSAGLSLPLDEVIATSLEAAFVSPPVHHVDVTSGDAAATVRPPLYAAGMLSDSSDDFDYGADAVPDDKAIAQAFVELDRLTVMAERATAARKRAEDALQKAKQAEEKLLNKDIPELLARMHLDECTTASGIEVKVKREIKASLPGHDRVEARMGALRWLVENGHGGVIKNSVAVSLDRGQDARADELVVKLRAEGYDVESKKDVNHQTLGALVRELMADGKIVPREYFNLFDMRLAKLSRKE